MLQVEVTLNNKHTKKFEFDQKVRFEELISKCKTSFGIEGTKTQLFYLTSSGRLHVKNQEDWRTCIDGVYMILHAQGLVTRVQLILESDPEPNAPILHQKQTRVPERLRNPFESSDEDEAQKPPTNQFESYSDQLGARDHSSNKMHSANLPMESKRISGDGSLNDWVGSQSVQQSKQTSFTESINLDQQGNGMLLNPFLTGDAFESQEQPTQEFRIAADSPARKISEGIPILKTVDEFFQELKQLNQDRDQRALIEQIEPKARILYDCLYGTQTSLDPLISACLKIAGAIENSQPDRKTTPKIHQIFTVLTGLLKPKSKGLLVQVATGEGKTLIGRMLAACTVLIKQKKVDFVSSANNLVEREVEESQQFYQNLGYQVGSCIRFHEKYKHVGQMDENNVYVQSDILCGTVHEFSANQLKDFISNLRYTPPPKKQQYAAFAKQRYSDCRPGAFLILDEVDNMFIDEHNNSTRLVTERTKMEALDVLMIEVWRKLQQMFTAERPKLEVVQSEILKTLEDPQYLKIFGMTADEKEIWDLSKRNMVESAYTARYLTHEQADYIIDRDAQRVIIVDRSNTGEVRHHSRWSNFLHEFLELKHNLPQKRSTEAAAKKSLVGFFDDYGADLFGMTGTLGDQAAVQFLKDTYNVMTLTVPRSNKDRRIIYEPILEQDRKIGKKSSPASKELQQFVIARVRQGQPCLIVSQTIGQADQLSSCLPTMVKNATGVTLNQIQFTRSDTENLHESVQSVDVHDIIFATALAGRGTDIRLSEQARANGGLSVVVNYLPDSVRTQRQIEGRSGRNGDNGSSIIIFSGLQGSQFETVESNIAYRNRQEAARLTGAKQLASDKRQEEKDFSIVKKLVSEKQTSNPVAAIAILDSFGHFEKKNELRKEQNDKPVQTIREFYNEIMVKQDQGILFTSQQSNVKNFTVAVNSTDKQHCEKLKAKLIQAKKTASMWQQKELSLLHAVSDINQGNLEEAERTLGELDQQELREVALIRGVSQLEVDYKCKAIGDQLTSQIEKLNLPKIEESVDRLAQNFSFDNCIEFFEMINKLANDNPILKTSVENFKNMPGIRAQADSNLNKLFEALFSSYGKLKQQAKKVIDHNKSRTAGEDKLFLKISENRFELDKIEIKSDRPTGEKQGYLGYILGGVMIIGGIAAICYFGVGSVVVISALRLISVGLDTVMKNIDMNSTGTYDQKSICCSAFQGVMKEVVTPLYKQCKSINIYRLLMSEGSISDKVQSFLSVAFSGQCDKAEQVTLAISCLAKFKRIISTVQMDQTSDKLRMQTEYNSQENFKRADKQDAVLRARLIQMDIKVKEALKNYWEDLDRAMGIRRIRALALHRFLQNEENSRSIREKLFSIAQSLLEKFKSEAPKDMLESLGTLPDFSLLNWTKAKQAALHKVKAASVEFWAEKIFSLKSTKLFVEVIRQGEKAIQNNIQAGYERRIQEIKERLKSQADNFDPNLSNDIESYNKGNPKKFTMESLNSRNDMKKSNDQNIQKLMEAQKLALKTAMSEALLKKKNALESLLNEKGNLEWLEETVDKLLEAIEQLKPLPSARDLLVGNIPDEYKVIEMELCEGLELEILKPQLAEDIKTTRDLLKVHVWSHGFDEVLDAGIRLNIAEQASDL